MIGRVRQAIMQAEFSNTPSIAETSRPGPVTNFLQKLYLPNFSGQVAEYPSFKQRFRDLTENAGYPLSVIMEHLKVAMPKDQHHLIDASSTMEEVWFRLDEQFGSRTMTILTVQRALVSLDLSKYKEYEKVQRLYDEISRGLRLLAPLKAEDSITRDLEIVSKLVEKLPLGLQVEWSRQATQAGRVVEAGNTEWPKFLTWLNQERRAAVLRRDYQLQRGSPNIPQNKPYCHRCSRSGHKHTECPNSVKTTTAGINYADGYEYNEDEAVAVAACNFANNQMKIENYQKAEKRVGLCPLCKKKHTYKKREGSGTTDWPSSHLESCEEFLKLTAVERGKKIQALKACPRCTCWLHRADQADKCKKTTGPICTRIMNGNRCDCMHSDMLHDSRNAYCEANVVVLTATGT